MARATTKKWISMAVGVALGVTDPTAAQQPSPEGTAAPPAAAPTRAGRAQHALTTAIDCYRRGDYELAANWFQQAQGAQADLNEGQRTDLAIWVQLNQTAVKSRRDGGELLRRAEQAAKAGRTQEALTCFQNLAAHQQFLTTADKQQYRLLEGQLRASNGLPATTPGLQLGRAKLQQARILMAQGNLDGAEALAREVDQMSLSFPAGDDTPRSVLNEVAHGRRTKPGAERTAAAPAGSGVTQTSFTSTPPKTDAAGRPVLKGADVGRQLLKQARQALQAGDLSTALKLATEARAYKQDLGWWDENPDKLVAEIQKAEASRKTVGGPPSVLSESGTKDPRTLVKQARAACAASNWAEAERLATAAQAARGVRWGLFEDSPDKLLSDIRKATQKRDQEEAGRALADARRLYQKAAQASKLPGGDPELLAQALDLTSKAERLHGPYSAWDLSDKPHKLRAEIEAAQARNRRQGVMPATVAQQPTPANARPALGATTEPATRQASTLPPPTPPVVTPEPRLVQAPTAPRLDAAPPVLTPPAPLMPAPEPGLAEQRTRLLAEARQCQADGKLSEARRLAVAAQKVPVSPGKNVESADSFLAALAAQAQRQVDSLLTQGTPDSCTQARQLAVAFGFDTQPIDSRLAAVRTPAVTPPTPTPPPAVVQGTQPLPGGAPAKQRGDELLHQARLELRRGETGAARRLAVEAFSGSFGVQAEAEKVLRSIDAEEFNQRILAASRSYDAGVSALQRQDSAQALTIFRTIEPSLLPPEKQTKLREILTGLDPTGTKPAVAQASDQAGPGRQVPAGPKDETYAQQVKALQDVKYQQLREEGLRVQNDAMNRFQAGDTDRALELLDDHLAALRNTQLEPQRLAMLRRPVEVRKEQLKTLKAQRDFEKLQVDQRQRHSQIAGGRQSAEDHKNKQVGELMKQYQAFYKEGKYREAEMYAMRALELDPDNAHASVAVHTARMMRNQTGYDQIKHNKEEVVRRVLNDAENPGPAVDSTMPLQFDPATAERNKGRKPLESVLGLPKTEKEREIQRRLHTPVNLEFKDASLEKAIDDLQEMTGINIHLHREALREAGIKLDQPVSLKVAQISLESALKILLKDVGLMHHIENEVLNITTSQHAKGKLVTRTFPVADLVLPIENYQIQSREQVLRASGTANAPIGGIQPYLSRNALRGGDEVSPATLGSEAGAASGGVDPRRAGGWQKHLSKGTIEDLLMKLIKCTISPNQWNDMGGAGNIEYYPLGMALIVNQTPDIQEQIAELLQALRRLQDQEVAVEVRFVTIAESFFERIGLDFNVNIKTNNTRYEPQIVTQQFKPFGFINDFEPKSTVIGLTPAGSFTSDLDIPIRTSSFAQAIPPFGAFPNIPGGNGGLELGLAFLSDIQVFLFMEAAQGDQRTNVMQAPKLTLNNGQTATISIEDQQYFVTNVSATQAGGQIVFTPTNQLLPIGGTSLTIQAVISADRRFVRLSLTPTLTNLASAVVQLFPITTFITPVFEGGAQGQPVPFTQFLQQPVFNSVQVQTTVTVPDGGTVLLGGLKRLSEGRNEFGPPILSKLPYINRLFKNVGYGREAESLMMMVTPRIIINEEEEEKFLRANPPATGQALP